MSKSIKFTVMVPVECTVERESQVRELWEWLLDAGGSYSSSGGYAGEIHTERVKLKDMKAAFKLAATSKEEP